jgi:parvulin-like peptidyl-prolyl isomerase
MGRKPVARWHVSDYGLGRDRMIQTDANQSVSRVRLWRARLGGFAAAVALVAVCAFIRSLWGPDAARAEPAGGARHAKVASRGGARPKVHAEAPTPELPSPKTLSVMAVVNGQQITRQELADECVLHFGEEVLESIINKRLITEECERRNIPITQEEVQQEMDRMAQRFGMPTDQLLMMLQKERHITPEQYAKEIIWPTVALRKLASDELKVTKKDMQEAWDMLYGKSVQLRLIACESARKAEQIRREVLADPDNFGNIAKEKSIDVVSASAKGLIQPVHMHQGDPNIEREAFALKAGQISNVIPVGDQFVILKCEAHFDKQDVPMQKVAKILEESIRDKKLRQSADQIFQRLQDAAKVENILNDPKARKRHPGVAAVVNGHKVTIYDVSEECLDRHGLEALEGLISRRILEQACQRRKVKVTQAEMRQEIARAAVTMGKTKGHTDEPDIDAWLKDVVENQKLSLDLYQRDVVWPSAALRKLVGEKIEVSDEDLKLSFEANFGKRVRCRAIVLANSRNAQAVWAEARKQASAEARKHTAPEARIQAVAEAFGELARKWSVDPSSRATDGEIPPIQQHGGQPLLEKEAFLLKPGEISGIIQVEEKWVILYCEGHTKPERVQFKDVEKTMREDLVAKKLELAMAAQFNKLQEDAEITNFFAHTSQPGLKGRQLEKALLTTPDEGLLMPDPHAPAPTAPPRGADRKPRGNEVDGRPHGAARR